MAITLQTVVSSITTAVRNGVTATVQDYSELSEAINDMPTIQCYPETGQSTAGVGQVKVGFGSDSGAYQKAWAINVDIYARQRSHIGEDMAALLPLIDAVIDVLEAEEKPYFGQSAIRGMTYQWNRVTFEYGGARYVGARFSVEVTVY